MSFTHFLKISHISKSSSNFVIFLIFALLTLVYISVVCCWHGLVLVIVAANLAILLLLNQAPPEKIKKIRFF